MNDVTFLVIAIKAAVPGANPELIALIFTDRFHRSCDRNIPHMKPGMVHKAIGSPVIDKEAIIQSDEDSPLHCDMDNSDHLAGTITNGDLFKFTLCFVETVDTVGSAHPEISSLVVGQAIDIVIGQMVAIGQIGAENSNPVAVITAEAIAGAKPHKSFAVLKHFLHLIRG